MSRTDTDARSFVARGVDVLSVPEFVRGFVGRPVTTEMNPHPGYFFIFISPIKRQQTTHR